MEPMEFIMGHVHKLDPDQLRSLIAHAAGIHAHTSGVDQTSAVLRRIADRLVLGAQKERLLDIARRVGAERGFTVEEIKLGKDGRECTFARWQIAYEARRLKRPDGTHVYSLSQIARFLGLYDATTVRAGLSRYRAMFAPEAARSAA